MNREEKNKHVISSLLGAPDGPRPGLETDSGVGLVSSVLWKLKPPQGNEMGCLPSPSLVQREGMGAMTLRACCSPSPRRSPGRQLWKVNSNNGLFQCPDSNPSVQLADTANSNSAAFSCCHNKLRAALMGGLGQEEGGCHFEPWESLGGKEGFPFFLISLLSKYAPTHLYLP